MTPLPFARRLWLAIIALVLSGVLLRGQLADALVLRGDVWLYHAHAERASIYYRRAAWIDRDDAAAIDRFAFVAMTLRGRATLRSAIALLSAYLERRPGNGVLLMDRAMLYRDSGERQRALRDFTSAGVTLHDARALTFAGYAAMSLGRRAQALALLRAALALDPTLPAARHALARATVALGGARR